MTTWNNNVKLFTDGVDQLKADDINPVVSSLANREQFLFDQLNSYSDKTILLSYNQQLAGNYNTGTPVYFDTSSGGAVLAGAMAGYSPVAEDGVPNPPSAQHLVPSPSSFVFGLVKNVYSGDPGPPYYGDVYVRGLVEDENLDYSLILDTQTLGEGTLLNGPLYLSNREPGKLSMFPSGASVFVGYKLGGHSMVLAPNIDSLNQLYFNYQVYLRSVPAGTVTITTGTATIDDPPSYDVVGWIGADQAASHYGFTAPANAKFYYNLPTDNEIKLLYNNLDITNEEAHDAYLLKRALPAHPTSYTWLFSNGVLQTKYDSDHTEAPYLIDANGVWWMHDDEALVPWSYPSTDLVLQLHITKLNPNYSSSVVTSLTSSNDTITITSPQGLSSSTGDLELKLNININQVPTQPGEGTAVQALSFNHETGVVTAPTVPVVNNISTGPGLSCTTTTGQAVISLDNYKLSGEIADIEPEEAEYVFKGLHSYLRLKRPASANQRIGFVGKFKLPATLPANTDLNIRLDCFADGSASGIGSTASFAFEYSLSSDSSSISNAITGPSNVVIPGSKFSSNVQTTIYRTGPLPSSSYFSIPASRLSPNAYVNVRIVRTYDAGSTYSNSIGVLGVNWIIE